MTFTGIQIIIVAAFYQLMSIISTAVILLVVFYGYREYETAIVIPVAAAMTVIFPFLGIGVYICTVKCCRSEYILFLLKCGKNVNLKWSIYFLLGKFIKTLFQYKVMLKKKFCNSLNIYFFSKKKIETKLKILFQNNGLFF